MKTSTFLLITGALAAGVYLLGRPGKTVVVGSSPAPEEDASAVVHLVEETLYQHEGEDSPIVHAFEEAVAHQHEAA